MSDFIWALNNFTKTQFKQAFTKQPEFNFRLSGRKKKLPFDEMPRIIPRSQFVQKLLSKKFFVRGGLCTLLRFPQSPDGGGSVRDWKGA